MSTVSSIVCSCKFLVTGLGSSISRDVLAVGFQVSTVSGIIYSCEFLVTGLGSIILKIK